MKLLSELVGVPNKGEPVALLRFGPRQGVAELQVTVPPETLVIVPLVEMRYAVVFTPVMFCLLAMLKKSPLNSRL